MKPAEPFSSFGGLLVATVFPVPVPVLFEQLLGIGGAWATTGRFVPVRVMSHFGNLSRPQEVVMAMGWGPLAARLEWARGPVVAGRLIEERQTKGPFARMELRRHVLPHPWGVLLVEEIHHQCAGALLLLDQMGLVDHWLKGMFERHHRFLGQGLGVTGQSLTTAEAMAAIS